MNKLPEDFDWKFYLNYYEDLRLAGIRTEENAKKHYLNHGQFENRKYVGVKNNSEEEFFDLHRNFNFEKIEQKKRILFINHHESLTGAPKLLKDLIRFEVKKNELDVWVLSLREGDDKKWGEFKNIKYNQVPGLNEKEKCNFVEKLLKPDLVYSNTFGSIKFSKYFNCKKILSSHDNKSLYEYYEYFDDCKFFDKIIVACENAKNILNIKNITSEIIPYYLEIKKENYSSITNKIQDNLIIGVGFTQTRKGVDRFIEVAKSLPEFEFIWLGSTEGVEIKKTSIKIVGNVYNEHYNDIDKYKKLNVFESNIPSNLVFFGLIDNYKEINEFFSKSKCFLMLSRDDTFPLVVIEAKLLNKNVVNLKESGDSYKLCDEKDLVLEKYNLDSIVSYLKKLKPNKVTFNNNLATYLEKNIEKNRKIYLELING